MENLSNDILEIIFSRVPILSVLQCQRVSKTWRSRLRQVYPKVGLLFLSVHVESSSLHKKNIRLDYVDDDDHHRNIYNIASKNCSLTDNDTIVGSCNGLVCLKVSKYSSTLEGHIEDPIFVCNPVTGESSFLPSFINSKSDWKRLVGGFGYLPSTNAYKIVRINYGDSSEGGHAEIYNLGSPGIGWRKIGKVPYTFWLSGILANGALHWVDNRYNNAAPRNRYNLPAPVIVAFDLAREIFQLVPSPPIDYSGGQSGNYCIKLKSFRGNLYVVHIQGNCLDIWSFKKEATNSASCEGTELQKYYYDCSWSWSKEFTVPCKFVECYEPFDITINNKVLLWRRKRDLYSYDPKTLALTKVMESKDCHYHQTVPHMNSLLSLKDLSYQSDTYEDYISDQHRRL